MKDYRQAIKDKKRIVVKIGSSSLQHAATGDLDYIRMDVLVRELCNLRNQGRDVVLVTSGAIAAGKKAVRPDPEAAAQNPIAVKQACAAIGQARLMMTYQKIFSEYNHVAAQILMTRFTVEDEVNRVNAQNTFKELFSMGVIPIVNENDTVSIDELELEIGENDSLAAQLAVAVDADLLVILSDINGLYSADPRKHQDAKVIHVVEKVDEKIEQMAGGAGTSFGTGGMATKIHAAKIATENGVDMVIMNGKDPEQLYALFDGEPVGTHFLAQAVE